MSRQGQSRTQGEFERGCISWTNSGKLRSTISYFQDIKVKKLALWRLRQSQKKGETPFTDYTILNNKKWRAANTFLPISHSQTFPAKLTQTKLSELGAAACFVIRSWINQEIAPLSFFWWEKCWPEMCTFSNSAQFNVWQPELQRPPQPDFSLGNSFRELQQLPIQVSVDLPLEPLSPTYYIVISLKDAWVGHCNRLTAIKVNKWNTDLHYILP